jgi:tetratricopeptide (TPR) repeat protein
VRCPEHAEKHLAVLCALVITKEPPVRWFSYKSAVLVLALSLILLGGGWYARGHYWLPKKSLEEAELALKEGEFERARLELDKCLLAWPRDPHVHFLLARTARRARDLDQAERHLLECEHLQNDRSDPRLGDTELERLLIRAQRGMLTETEHVLRRRIQQGHPDRLLILEALSWELMGRNRLSEALALLNLWLDEQPDDFEALVRRGWVHEHMFDLDKSALDYRKALAQRPSRDNVRLRLTEVLLARNQTSDAMTEAEELVRRQPQNPDANYCYARCLRLLGRTQDAEQCLDRLLASQPRHAKALGMRAQLAVEAGRDQEASELLPRAIELDPSAQSYRYTLMLCLNRLGKTKEAKVVEAQMAASATEIRRMDTLVREVNQKPNDPNLRYEAAMIFLRNGFTQEGLRWLYTALDVDPNHRPTHQALAGHFERTGEKERAQHHRRFLDKP